MSDYIGYIRNLVGKNPLIMVVAGVIVVNEKNEILLQKRSDNSEWGFPGGYMEMGESLTETAKREVYEETGLTLSSLTLLGMYSGEGYHRTLPNGDQVQLVKAMFIGREFSGEIRKDEESLDIKFFTQEEMPKLWTSHEKVWQDYLKFSGQPTIE
ncbi:DNA mismatch repair protein MutT [Bacillus coahuilensis m2-6]|uniref:DNA mismatch repair protein MutT n=1 Tax=Bacillus coahuilensis p1.1.43 TaxID=1150625 RepID=A0A147K935_9BACI|nr:NUDIX domain-containing protein [Bacillus coahuilensis]KUP06861.1 DNA mismatch repair protein MutT [Bacillus coahuilensis p1.1.43]KUP08411.1 DNA mismatch repair protein MutT [Bacillus coahuilensis m2-6]